jgi:hypothetical protein
MIPLVELALETCLNRGCSGQTSGTVNPGSSGSGNTSSSVSKPPSRSTRGSGKNVGVLALVHFFIDDLFPQSLGRPLFP